jgi:hypothetical protein
MVTYLRALGTVVLLIGMGVAADAFWQLAADTHFQEVAAAYARHPEHALFQTEYWSAAAQHYGLLMAAAAGVLGGLVISAVLFALASLVRRLPPS